ncbi:hypothetical protein [Alicyclobacillus tolerans]|nr:hypothetical protein [Alicyclobacillus tengchongensis]MDP9729248.1 hypothetical protein [Alicyclobacillus tengchongensis]
METKVFQTVVLSHTDEAQNQLLLRMLQERVAKSEIRIVDVKRLKKELVITYRVLQP